MLMIHLALVCLCSSKMMNDALVCSGESTDLSFLDPISRADTPPRAIQLAAGELSLRLQECRRRIETGLGDAIHTIRRCRMSGKAGPSSAVQVDFCCFLIGNCLGSLPKRCGQQCTADIIIRACSPQETQQLF